MSLNIHKPLSRRYQQERRKRLSIRGKLGVQARNRNRMEAIGTMRPCGGFVTYGCLGHHRVQLLAYADARAVAVVVDGRHRRPRTFRGLVRVMAELLFRRVRA